MASFERLRPLLSSLLRRGRRTVLLTGDPGPRLGNLLYFWMWAQAEGLRRRREVRVRVPRAMRPWLDHFPAIARDLSVTSEGVRLWDGRKWPNEWHLQRFGVDFTAGEVDRFVSSYLLTAPLLRDAAWLGERTVVINIRRGDYYAVPAFRESFGFDLAPFLRSAMGRLIAREPVEDVLVVSDDPVWCVKHVPSMLEPYAGNLTFSLPGESAAANFRAVASARRLIGANSTFSYWGGYIATLRFGRRAHVVMPGFHSRTVNAGVAYQLDPRWDTVWEVPGGWRLPPDGAAAAVPGA